MLGDTVALLHKLNRPEYGHNIIVLQPDFQQKYQLVDSLLMKGNLENVSKSIIALQ